MIVAGIYSFKGGKEIFESKFRSDLIEIEQVIAAADSESGRSKTKTGKAQYKPKYLSKAFGQEFLDRGWQKHEVTCQYSPEHYISSYKPTPDSKSVSREMEFVKNRIGIEVQFGKYRHAVYDLCAKMTIFHKLNVIDAGIEIIPVENFARQMPAGMVCFEQFVWDLEHRGVADIDIPVLILGIAK